MHDTDAYSMPGKEAGHSLDKTKKFCQKKKYVTEH